MRIEITANGYGPELEFDPSSGVVWFIALTHNIEPTRIFLEGSTDGGAQFLLRDAMTRRHVESIAPGKPVAYTTIREVTRLRLRVEDFVSPITIELIQR